MKLKFDVTGKNQPDPFIFEDGDKLYLYVTAYEGVEVYSADDLFGVWHYEGIVANFADKVNYWAPSVIKYNGMYYMYVSCEGEGVHQYMHVAKSASPLGPFTDEKMLYDYFSIDSHAVRTDSGLFLLCAMDNVKCEKKGTRIFVDKLIDPYTPVYAPKEIIVPSFEQEQYTPNCKNGNLWYTIEGPFWFEEDGWQYVMYSGGCYQDDTYHIGYSSAKTKEQDLTEVDYIKNTDNGKFAPVLIKNDFEEGTGHHSVIKYKGDYYAIYHGRDYRNLTSDEYEEARTARVCKLNVNNGVITAERYENHV